jgi:hypothetical protein
MGGARGPRQGKSHPTNFLHIFLGKAKYFITILKSLCGTAKLLFYQYVRIFQQNLPKICILWVCLSASEMVGKCLWEHLAFQNFPDPTLGFAPLVLALTTRASPSAPQQKNPRYGPANYGTVGFWDLLGRSSYFHQYNCKSIRKLSNLLKQHHGVSCHVPWHHLD